MTRNKKWILGTSIGVIIFAILMIIGTFFDLSISKALTNFSLPMNTYYTTNFFAKYAEVLGAFPIWMCIVFACLILTYYFFHQKGKIKYIYLVFALGQIGAATLFNREVAKYALRFMDMENILNRIWMLAFYGVIAVAFLVIINYLYFKKITRETNNKLVLLSFVIFASAVFYLLVKVIKVPFARIRYRTMNEINDFSYFVPWYHFGNQTGLDVSSLPDDSFESFPSGHTFAAAFIFILTCLPDLFDSLNNRKTKIIFYSIAIIYTVLIALLRIIAGAHFLTDVTFGGFLAIGVIFLFRYIFIVRNGRIIKIDSKE